MKGYEWSDLWAAMEAHPENWQPTTEAVAHEMLGAIRNVASGGRHLAADVTKLVLSEYVNHAAASSDQSPLDTLTPKERELLQMLVEGRSSKEASRLLHTSVKTIDARRRSIMTKLATNSLPELTKLAIREGITSVEF